MVSVETPRGVPTLVGRSRQSLVPPLCCCTPTPVGVRAPRGAADWWGGAGRAWYPHTGDCTPSLGGGGGTGAHPVHAEWVDTEWLT